jgi:excisionase family DNA binding protein
MKKSGQLYRHFNKYSQLLYVGVSLSAISRLRQHKDKSHWFGKITRVEVEVFATRGEALIAERKAIETERPRHNKAHKPKCAAFKKYVATVKPVSAPVNGGPMIVDQSAIVLNTDTAARWVSLRPGEIRKLVANGELAAWKEGDDWLFTIDELKRWAASLPRATLKPTRNTIKRLARRAAVSEPSAA